MPPAHGGDGSPRKINGFLKPGSVARNDVRYYALCVRRMSVLLDGRIPFYLGLIALSVMSRAGT
jgi:hypothetical protein